MECELNVYSFGILFPTYFQQTVQDNHFFLDLTKKDINHFGKHQVPICHLENFSHCLPHYFILMLFYVELSSFQLWQWGMSTQLVLITLLVPYFLIFI